MTPLIAALVHVAREVAPNLQTFEEDMSPAAAAKGRGQGAG